VAEPSGPTVFGANPYGAKRPVIGRVVAVLRGVTDRRGLYLTEYRSRAVPCGQIHELMVTDEDAQLESTVNRVALLAFFEVEVGGVLLVGDRVTSGARELGRLAGYDETHMPNHQNICVVGSDFRAGETLGLQVGDELTFAR
jgi:hypothetical protein